MTDRRTTFHVALKEDEYHLVMLALVLIAGSEVWGPQATAIIKKLEQQGPAVVLAEAA